MTYATIMVSTALGQPNEARLEGACQIAERFDAGIVGIAAAQFSPAPYFTSGEQAQNLIDQGHAALEKRLSELEAQFRGAVKNRAKFAEWRSTVDFPTRYILSHTRCADLVVSGGHSDAFSDPFTLASPKDLVMQAGRPLLVVPDMASWVDLRSVLVAWKDTTEARRAVVDSLPLLRKATDVAVAEIVEAGESRPTALKRVCDVVAWLSRHGVIAREQVPETASHRSPAAELDRIAANVGAGIIVAGAYGHSRFRELILGGMTQHLITQTARCVLLSH